MQQSAIQHATDQHLLPMVVLATAVLPCWLGKLANQHVKGDLQCLEYLTVKKESSFQRHACLIHVMRQFLLLTALSEIALTAFQREISVSRYAMGDTQSQGHQHVTHQM